MSGRSVARLRYGLAMPPVHVSAAVDTEPAMKRRRLKGLLVMRMKCPSGIRGAPSSIISVQIYSCPREDVWPKKGGNSGCVPLTQGHLGRHHYSTRQADAYRSRCLAEFERELILARTSDGRARAKARGVKFGRPSALTRTNVEVLQSLANGTAQVDIARAYGVSQATISRLGSA
jgi:hypothetical protein